MLDGCRIGLKVDVDTLRGTREGVPRLAALFKKHRVDATFYFSVGPDHTGRALRRVFRPGFFQKVARTSVLKHYGLKTLLYGVLLPGPDIGRAAAADMRAVYDAGFEVGLHTYDHVRWQDHVAAAPADWTRREFERGVRAFEAVFGFPPDSHAAAGWQINDSALGLEREFGMKFASDTRGHSPFLPIVDGATSPCVQLPTTLPTFDEVLGVDGIDETSLSAALFARSSAAAATAAVAQQVFTLHAELEGLLLIDAFEDLLIRWRDAGAVLARMATLHEQVRRAALPSLPVVMGPFPGRSGVLALQGSARAVAA
jgi:peptidoglycan/xylan/chitin deacetylase (PgdA/CDA1 family)